MARSIAVRGLPRIECSDHSAKIEQPTPTTRPSRALRQVAAATRSAMAMSLQSTAKAPTTSLSAPKPIGRTSARPSTEAQVSPEAIA